MSDAITLPPTAPAPTLTICDHSWIVGSRCSKGGFIWCDKCGFKTRALPISELIERSKQK